ncbi:hypothetical protein QJS04_geneDACA009625 [Acorus gramineus]|uniref:Uncharacterized protein n=1 Tax=Acorus gramineus TaxID=55184 RepID=A0AAV9BE40_ACOGR|nr:hypothetical protein QJS04_geneDACA009625 [Acorus gramineus]
MTASQRYTTTRAELKGGNLRNAFRLQSEGIYMNAPLQNRSNTPKSMQAVKVMSVDGLKKALSNASQVTTKSQSQGIRFLREVTEDKHAKDSSKEPTKRDKQHSKSNPRSSESWNMQNTEDVFHFLFRFSSSVKMASKIVIKSQLPAEMKKKTEPSKENLIELDLVSSDEEG